MEKLAPTAFHSGLSTLDFVLSIGFVPQHSTLDTQPQVVVGLPGLESDFGAEGLGADPVNAYALGTEFDAAVGGVSPAPGEDAVEEDDLPSEQRECGRGGGFRGRVTLMSRHCAGRNKTRLRSELPEQRNPPENTPLWALAKDERSRNGMIEYSLFHLSVDSMNNDDDTSVESSSAS